jgi:ANTAR domain
METVDHPGLDALLERSRSVRAESSRLAARYSEIRDTIGRERGSSLTPTTAAIDGQTAGHPLMVARLNRLSTRIGRTPEIEEAKTMLAGRYGITRGEAFAILRSVSSHTNRKLRDVATELVHEASEGERGTLRRSG